MRSPHTFAGSLLFAMKKIHKGKGHRSATLTYALAILAAVAAVIAIVVVSIYGSDSTEKPASSLPTSESVPASSEPPIEAVNRKDFTLLESAEPTMQGHNGYFTQEFAGELAIDWDKAFAEKWATPENAVEGVQTFLGNQVYCVPLSALTEEAPSEDEEMVYIQLYGYTPNVVDPDGYVRNTRIWMRQEWTGMRIYPFETEDELRYAQECWDAGQAILKGGAAPERAILVNGRLLKGYTYQEKDGEIYVPLRQIAQVVNKDLFYDNTDLGMLTVPLQGVNVGNCVTVPYGILNDKTFTAGGTYDLGEYGSENAWSDTFQSGYDALCYVPVSELSRYTGWFIYSNGETIHIVTDETDESGLFVLAAQGNRSAEQQTQNGGQTITKYLNPNEVVLPEEAGSEAAAEETGGESLEG